MRGPTRSQICNWLKSARINAGLSRRAVSHQIDVTERAIQSWEDVNDTPLPPADKLFALVLLYRADITALLQRPSRDVPREDRDRMDRELAEIQAKERDSPKDSGHKPDAHRRRAGGKGR